MTDLGQARSGAKRTPAKQPNRGAAFFGAIGLFIRQILDELRKVVRPTKSELWNYTLVVIVFVVAIMAIVYGLDKLFALLVRLVFGT